MGTSREKTARQIKKIMAGVLIRGRLVEDGMTGKI